MSRHSAGVLVLGAVADTEGLECRAGVGALRLGILGILGICLYRVDDQGASSRPRSDPGPVAAKAVAFVVCGVTWLP